jgi:hypothetical protein
VINRDGVAYRLAIVSVGAALVAMLIGASTVAALGHAVPKELWAIGGALSGALVGILIPTPRAGTGREATPRAAGYATHNAAVDAARKKVEEVGHAAAAQAAAQPAAVAPAAAHAAAEPVAVEPAATHAAAEQVAAQQAAAAHAAAEQVAAQQAAAQAAMAGAQKALKDVEGQRRQLKAPLVGMASAAALREGGQGHEAAAVAVNLQYEALQKADDELLVHPDDPGLKASAEVHEAAHAAAAKAAPKAAQGEAGWFGAVKAITSEARILVPLLLFVVALGLAVLLGLGVIRAHPCTPEASSCSYYATTTKELAKAMVALASTAGGALVGVFATSPGEASKTEPVAAKGQAG